jgi:hypothetical protein
MDCRGMRIQFPAGAQDFSLLHSILTNSMAQPALYPLHVKPSTPCMSSPLPLACQGLYPLHVKPSTPCMSRPLPLACQALYPLHVKAYIHPRVFKMWRSIQHRDVTFQTVNLLQHQLIILQQHTSVSHKQF